MGDQSQCKGILPRVPGYFDPLSANRSADKCDHDCEDVQVGVLVELMFLSCWIGAHDLDVGKSPTERESLH
jgi:hypothetical protein